MSFDPQTTYPSERSFVLKLHRDAAVTGGEICGQLEHIPSGRRCRFASLAELHACLVAVFAATPCPHPAAPGTGNPES